MRYCAVLNRNKLSRCTCSHFIDLPKNRIVIVRSLCLCFWHRVLENVDACLIYTTSEYNLVSSGG